MHFLAETIVSGHPIGQGTEPAPGSEAFVLVTLALLAFLFGAFSVAFLVLWHRGRRPSPHRQLLMEMEDQDSPSAKPQPPSGEEEIPRHPWEQKADWWKK